MSQGGEEEKIGEAWGNKAWLSVLCFTPPSPSPIPSACRVQASGTNTAGMWRSDSGRLESIFLIIRNGQDLFQSKLLQLLRGGKDFSH